MNLSDGAWLDRMYNNRALVPECEEHFARWRRMSERVRSEGECVLDLPYGPTPLQSLDVFPAPRPHAHTVVFIHGGYWRSLDKSDHSFVAPTFQEAGACVVVPNYDLCPAVTIPDIALQMVQALLWTWKNAATYGGDPRRTTVIGHSAGGHLAAMLLACEWQRVHPELPQDLVRKALSISGLFDLEPVGHTPFLRDSLRLTEADAVRASPAFMPTPQGTLYAVAGALESPEFVRQNALIRQAWGAGCVEVCEALPGLDHFTILEALAQPGHVLQEMALELLER
jgi:arylformamidase